MHLLVLATLTGQRNQCSTVLNLDNNLKKINFAFTFEYLYSCWQHDHHSTPKCETKRSPPDQHSSTTLPPSFLSTFNHSTIGLSRRLNGSITIDTSRNESIIAALRRASKHTCFTESSLRGVSYSGHKLVPNQVISCRWAAQAY